MKLYILTAIIFLSGKILFAQTVDVNVIENNPGNDLVKSKKVHTNLLIPLTLTF